MNAADLARVKKRESRRRPPPPGAGDGVIRVSTLQESYCAIAVLIDAHEGQDPSGRSSE